MERIKDSIAVIVVEAECKVRWSWFLEQLIESIGRHVDMVDLQSNRQRVKSLKYVNLHC